LIRILLVGDVVGKPGRRAVRRLLPELREKLGVSFVIVNGENAAGGLGITRQTGGEMFASGADVITLGNHSFAKREALEYVAEEPRLIRPANYPPGVPGNGWGVFPTSNGSKVAVVSLLGRTFMDAIDCPFRAADRVLNEIAEQTKAIVFDVHAEATSEKNAVGWYLDGRASAVIGTHTHVQTSDERVLPNGTAYITDVGMTGVADSVLGLDRSVVIERFKTSVLHKFALADGDSTLHAVCVEIDEVTGRALSLTRVSVPEQN
jgi:metallophosphoesterase (TIGR00282 family)